MAYTPIQPLPTRENTGLEAMASGISYIRQVNEIKRKENEQRQQQIIDKLNDVDLPTAIEMANKNRQKQIYIAAQDEITRLLAPSAKRGGTITMEERMEADRIIKTLDTELGKIHQSEKMYQQRLQEAAKQPGVYTMESVERMTDMWTKGQDYQDVLEYAPVPFTVMENDMRTLLKDRMQEEKVIKDGKEVTVQKVNIDDKDKAQLYRMNKQKVPGYAKSELMAFRQLKQANPEVYQAYMSKNNGIEGFAAAEFGEERIVPELLKDQVIDVRPPKKTSGSGSSKDNIKPIDYYLNQDGQYRWIIGGGRQTFTGKLKTLNQGEVDVVDADVSEVVYNPIKPEESYITFTINQKEDKPGSYNITDDGVEIIQGSKGSKPSTYVVPYMEYSSWIKNNYNLRGLEKVEKEQPKQQFIGVPKGGF